jgi:hypothetical protein
MDLLLERRAAWRALRPNRRASVALAGHCHAYELVGGLFAKALEEHGAARRLVASWLPSNTTSETRLVVDDLGVRIKDFALDPAQDLVVLLEHRPAYGPFTSMSSTASALADVRVHLRKLSAGVVAPHPAAKNPVLCRPALGPVHGCMIQIVEDVVGMYFWMPFHGVLIWNWMTGEELVVRSPCIPSLLEQLPYYVSSSFKRIKHPNVSGTFRSSPRARTWLPPSKMAARSAYTALPIRLLLDDRRTLLRCTYLHLPIVASCLSSQRPRVLSSPAHLPIRHLHQCTPLAFMSLRYTTTQRRTGVAGSLRASSCTISR